MKNREKSKQTIGHKIKNHFTAGIIAIIPIGFSLLLLWWIFQTLDLILGKILSKYIGFYIYGIGLLALILFIWIIGFITSSYLGNKLFKFQEKIVLKIPILNTVFKTLKQISQNLLDNKKRSFKQAVLVEVFHKGYLSIGFIANTEPVTIKNHQTKMIHVFVPTAPNPTSGFLMLIEENKITKLNIPVEDAFKAIFTAGMIYPEEYK